MVRGRMQALNGWGQAVSSSLDLTRRCCNRHPPAQLRWLDADSVTLYQFDEADGVFDPRNCGVSDEMIEILRGSA